ncbi:MAG: ABC transporter transmembrane domain-containing protein [Salaquimonas sp.]
MSKSFLHFVWTYSARWQVIILILTAAYFPFLYLTLELPKQIINDAIGGERFPVNLFGFDFEQLEYLVALSCAYLFMVLSSGLLKMKTNTFKGIVGERLLRRFRYMLISRIVRFPLPYFKQTSQGSLMSMVTAEAEAIGAMMGEAFATPVFAAGQMVTILLFLFVQNFWLGVAAVAMIPLQAYIVPKMQKKINLINRKRILEVRKLSEHIGETVTGVEDIRTNGGIMYTLANFSHRFAHLFDIRLEIYHRKFFMKFVNNTLNQLTPFYLLLIGGYLVINDQLTIGALAAALASYKDLLGPWRELLAYYSQIQDTSLRYNTIIDQFDPPDMIDENLFYGRAETLPAWKGGIELKNATVLDQFGLPILSGLNAKFPPGSYSAIRSENADGRHALARALSRAMLLSSGSVLIDDSDLNTFHQDAVSQKIGVVLAEPHLFGGNIEHNAQLALWRSPPDYENLSDEQKKIIEESVLVGNSSDPTHTSWVDLHSAGYLSDREMRDWWAHIIGQIGLESYFQRQSLRSKIDVEKYQSLTEEIVKLRGQVRARIQTEQLDTMLHRFDFDVYNPSLTPIENALYGLRNSLSQSLDGRINPKIWALIQDMGVAEYHERWAFEMLETLVQTFSNIGTDHPMFLRLENVTVESFNELKRIYHNNKRGMEISSDDRAIVMTLPLSLTAEELGDAFPDSLKEFILSARNSNAAVLREKSGSYYDPIDETEYLPQLSIMENIIFGKLRQGVDAEAIQNLVMNELEKAGIGKDVLLLVGDVETDFSAGNLESISVEGIAFVRAALKKPVVLILDKPFSAAPPEVKTSYLRNVRTLLPQTTIIELDTQFGEDQPYDQKFELKDGRLVNLGGEAVDEGEVSEDESSIAISDLAKKIRVLSQVELLSDLDRAQIRLLAFGARWIEMPKGEYFFRKGDPADGAYIFTSGVAELLWPTKEGGGEHISDVEPGRLVGDLAVIMKQGRNLDMVAKTDIVGLRIDKQVLTDVIEHDAGVATSLLRTVAGYLQDAGQRIADRELEIIRIKEGKGSETKPNNDLRDKELMGTIDPNMM